MECTKASSPLNDKNLQDPAAGKLHGNLGLVVFVTLGFPVFLSEQDYQTLIDRCRCNSKGDASDEVDNSSVT